MAALKVLVGWAILIGLAGRLVVGILNGK